MPALAFQDLPPPPLPLPGLLVWPRLPMRLPLCSWWGGVSPCLCIPVSLFPCPCGKTLEPGRTLEVSLAALLSLVLHIWAPLAGRWQDTPVSGGGLISGVAHGVGPSIKGEARAGHSADLTTLRGLATLVHTSRKWLYFYAAPR